MRDELDEVLECAYDQLCMYFEPEDLARLKAIRDRERNLAALACAMGAILMNIRHEMGNHFDREINPDLADWLRRYEEVTRV